MENLTIEKKNQILDWFKIFFEFVPCGLSLFEDHEMIHGVEQSGAFYFQLMRLEEGKNYNLRYPFRVVAILPALWIFYDISAVVLALKYGWDVKDVRKSFYLFLSELKKFHDPQEYPENYDQDLNWLIRLAFESEVPLSLLKTESMIDFYCDWLSDVSRLNLISLDEKGIKEIKTKLIENKPSIF